MEKICKECGRSFSPLRIYPMEREKIIIEQVGMCEECFGKSKGLIKVGNHYVPWIYHHNINVNLEEKTIKISKTNSEYIEDINSSFPKAEWDEEYKKYKVSFDGADFGGYDVEDFEWYFDTKEDILGALFN